MTRFDTAILVALIAILASALTILFQLDQYWYGKAAFFYCVASALREIRNDIPEKK